MKLFLIFLHCSGKVVVLQTDNQWRCCLFLFSFCFLFFPLFSRLHNRAHRQCFAPRGERNHSALVSRSMTTVWPRRQKRGKKKTPVWGSGCGFSAAQMLPMFCFSRFLHSNDPQCSLVTLLEGISSREGRRWQNWIKTLIYIVAVYMSRTLYMSGNRQMLCVLKVNVGAVFPDGGNICGHKPFVSCDLAEFAGWRSDMKSQVMWSGLKFNLLGGK